MSELNEPLWAVLGERGVEAAGVTYSEAAETVKRLAAEGVRGLCIITHAAAKHINDEEQAAQPATSDQQSAT